MGLIGTLLDYVRGGGTARQLAALDADFARGIAQPALAHSASPAVPTLHMSDLGPRRVSYRWDDGSKFDGGFGPTKLLTIDYWTLRARSAQLFETNHYANGVIRRLITNEINTGLHLEATPAEPILGFEPDGLADWSEEVETRFELWQASSQLCDFRERLGFGQLQAQARREALISGDVLVVLRMDQRTRLPRIQLVSGGLVQSPLRGKVRKGNRVVHGVELNEQGRHVAYWVRQRDLTMKRLPAWGEKSGRRLAWMLYGTEPRLDQVRGKPLLALMLQSLAEIDRYRDSTQRKALLLSMLAMFIKKGEERPGTRPITGGAVRLEQVQQVDTTGETERSYNAAELIPGLILDELQVGEEPQAFQTQGTTEEFGTFEEAIVQSIAWSLEIPPEILRLTFSNNYSASQAAINEFKIYLNRVRTDFGRGFCQPIYNEWLVSEALLRRVEADGLLEAWRDVTKGPEFAAWTAADWAGHIKPSTDIFKQARGYELLISMGLITRDRASRELTGTKYSKNAAKLRRENEQLSEAREPLASAEAEEASSSAPSLALVEDRDDEDDDDRETG